MLNNEHIKVEECVCGDKENGQCDCGNCSCGENNNVLYQLKYLIDTVLTDEQRVELFSTYCVECGKILEDKEDCDCYNYE